MELFVSCCGWGTRKGLNGLTGIYRLDFDAARITQSLELPIAPGAYRGFGGITYDDRFLYAARTAGPEHDEIVRIERDSLQIVDAFTFEAFADVHQIDYYAGLLWLTNSNHHELIVTAPDGRTQVRRLTIFPGVPTERERTPGTPTPTGDLRRRHHINSIQVRSGEVQLGLFGVNEGSFLSPQLVRVPWRREPAGVWLGAPEPVAVTGFRYPHNVQLRPDGTVLGCGSADGEFVACHRKVRTGGWTRGIAIDDRHYYVGISSQSFSFAQRPNETVPENPAEVVRIDRQTLEVTGRFAFGKPGQIYDVRLAAGPDYGLSADAEADPGARRRRLAI